MVSLVLAALIPALTFLANNPTAKTSFASNSAITPAKSLDISKRDTAAKLCAA